MSAHLIAMYALPVLWILMSLVSMAFTVPVLGLRGRLFEAAKDEFDGATPDELDGIRLGIELARDDLRGAQMRFMVQFCFVLLGILSLGVFPVLFARIAITVLFFTANALMGAKSVRDSRGLSRALVLAERSIRRHRASKDP